MPSTAQAITVTLPMEPEPEQEIGTISLGAYLRLVRENRNFRRLWAAQIVSEIGDWFYSLAIYSLLLQMTGHARSVALALVLQVIPQTLFGPLSGVVNDRVSRKRVMIISDLVRVLIVLCMLLVRSQSMIWLVYPLLFLESVMWAFFEPARTAVIPNITTSEDLILANTLSSTTWSLNLVAGAALGGLALALLGYNASFVLNALSFLVSAYLISGMHFEEPHTAAFPKWRLHDLLDYFQLIEGLRYVRNDGRLLATVLVKTGLIQMGVSWVLFTVMGQRVFALHWNGLEAQSGAVLGMSLLMGARGLGALFGPLGAARWAGHRESRLRLGILFGFLAVGLGYGMLGVAGSLWMACFWVVLGHCGGSTVWVFSTTLLQLNTEDKFRGRVFSAELGLSMLTLAVTAYLTGILVDGGINPRTVAIATGFIMLVPAGLWSWAMRMWKPVAATAPAKTLH
ncbi:MAG TPA: MFS transporter [Terriglobales bacterium]|nr:MFS transporter [Terriglobales bacterium]